MVADATESYTVLRHSGAASMQPSKAAASLSASLLRAMAATMQPALREDGGAEGARAARFGLEVPTAQDLWALERDYLLVEVAAVRSSKCGYWGQRPSSRRRR